MWVRHVNSYRDTEGKRSFAELLAPIREIPGIRRVRFTTSHPRDFTRDIVEAIEAVPALCVRFCPLCSPRPYFLLPVHALLGALQAFSRLFASLTSLSTCP
jgi:hypothetical protein